MIAPPSNQQSVRARVESNEDSDSDWDEDDDFVSKKINIRIKPVTELAASEKISASADELRASMGTWKSMANINLVKPNSRRSMHQSTVMLNKVSTDSNYELAKHHSTHINRDETHQDLMQPISTFKQASPLNEPPMFSDSHRQQPVALTPLVLHQTQPKRVILPVALATQECLHVRFSSTGDIQSNLIGHIKMAVPRNIVKLNPEHFQNNDMLIQILTSKRWSSIRGNQSLLKCIQETQDHSEGYFGTTISLNMEAVHEHANLLDCHSPRPYILLPELATYKLQSQVSNQKKVNDENQLPSDQHISPVRATTHWLCDPSTTKVRTDIEFLAESLHLPEGIKPCDVTDIVVSMQVDGNVVSHQSKPQASWDPVRSRLSWSFASFQELFEGSTTHGVASCLAKLVLTDGPSKPSETSLQFSIVGKTISNVQISLSDDPTDHLTYRLAKSKQEVRTGTFKCEPQV